MQAEDKTNQCNTKWKCKPYSTIRITSLNRHKRKHKELKKIHVSNEHFETENAKTINELRSRHFKTVHVSNQPLLHHS